MVMHAKNIRGGLSFQKHNGFEVLLVLPFQLYNHIFMLLSNAFNVITLHVEDYFKHHDY
jgi:hypothetical protein